MPTGAFVARRNGKVFVTGNSGFPKSKNLSGDWEGWGSAMKPAYEPVIVARKPLIGTVAQNVTTHGTGALNIAACRIGTGGEIPATGSRRPGGNFDDDAYEWPGEPGAQHPNGRWPANLILGHAPDCRPLGTKRVKSDGHYPAAPGCGGIGNDGHAGQADLDERYTDGETVEAWACVDDCPIRQLDAQTGERKAGGKIYGDHPSYTGANGIYGTYGRIENKPFGDTGGGSRFVLNIPPDLPIDDPDLVRLRYSPKAPRSERNAGLAGMPEKMLRWSSGDQNPGSFQSEGTNKYAANSHPTVKPIQLCRWLCRLVTPPGGTILDPFTGSGTTGIAAALEGFDFIGYDLSDEYVEIARRRIAHWAGNPVAVPLFGDDAA